MTETLYNYLKFIDVMELLHEGVKIHNSNRTLANTELNQTLKYINQSNEQDISALIELNAHLLNKIIKENNILLQPKDRKTIIKIYENNPVFSDAIKGKITIHDSLEELSQVNKGYKKLLPRRKNHIHNERIKQLGELVDEPYGLKSNGVFYPDNFFTNTAYFGGVAFILAYSAISSSLGHSMAVDLNTDNARSIYVVKTLAPVILSGMLGPMFGVLSTGSRFKSLDSQKEQAKYIDDKIKQIYLDNKI